MGLNRLLLSILVLICLALQASSQGYAGTVTTGTGIIPPLKVGSSETPSASLGASAAWANLTGIWSLDLRDSEARHMELKIMQRGQVLMGQGNLTAGDASRKVTASGYTAGNSLSLFVSVIDEQKVYRLELTPSGTSLTGKYNAYSSSSAWSGTVAGTISQSAVMSSKETGSKETIALGMDLSKSASAVDVRSSAMAQEPINDASSSDHISKSRNFSSTNSGQTSPGGTIINYNGMTTTTSDVTATTNYN